MVIIQDEKVLLLHQSIRDYLVRDDSDYFNELKTHALLAYYYVDLLIEPFCSTN
jgi:hypothetical protein